MQIVFQVISTVISIITIIFCILTYANNRKKEAVQSTKENHQELIEYQLKELKDDYKEMLGDIKDIKKMLIDYKETTRAIVKEEMDEHVKKYHKGE